MEQIMDSTVNRVTDATVWTSHAPTIRKFLSEQFRERTKGDNTQATLLRSVEIWTPASGSWRGHVNDYKPRCSHGCLCKQRKAKAVYNKGHRGSASRYAYSSRCHSPARFALMIQGISVVDGNAARVRLTGWGRTHLSVLDPCKGTLAVLTTQLKV